MTASSSKLASKLVWNEQNAAETVFESVFSSTKDWSLFQVGHLGGFFDVLIALWLRSHIPLSILSYQIGISWTSI